MTVSQPGIFALGTRSHHHLEFAITGDPRNVVAAIARIREATNTVAGVNVVAGFGHRLWSELAPDHVPAEFGDFEPIRGVDGFEMPAAQHDLWLWLHGGGPDAVFQIARVVRSSRCSGGRRASGASSSTG